MQTHTPAHVAQLSRAEARARRPQRKERVAASSDRVGFYRVGISRRFDRLLKIYSSSKKGAAAPRVVQQLSERSGPSLGWGQMAGAQEERGNQCHDAEGTRQPQITTPEGMSGPEHTRGFLFPYFLIVLELYEHEVVSSLRPGLAVEGRDESWLTAPFPSILRK